MDSGGQLAFANRGYPYDLMTVGRRLDWRAVIFGHLTRSPGGEKKHTLRFRCSGSSLPLVLALLLSGCSSDLVASGEQASLVAGDRADLVVSLVDEAGAPVAGWVVVEPSGRDAASDEDGEARFVALSAGPVDVVARAPGFADAGPTTVLIPAAGSVVETLTLYPAAAASLDVTVTAPDGAFVPGASVFVDDVELGVTDDAGWLRIEGLDAGHVSVAVVPVDDMLLAWDGPVELRDASRSALVQTLAARSSDGAVYVGSGPCAWCHDRQMEPWATSAHGRSRRAPSVVEADGPSALVDSFADGDVISLDALASGATLVLARSGPGAWTADVQDGSGGLSGPLPIVEVYGGYSAGFAFAVEAGEGRRVLPAGWSTSSAGWVAAWGDGWFDGAALADPVGPEASFDLRCAGCHATGYAVDEQSGAFVLAAAPDSVSVEGAVGCEACHGPASEHPEPDDGGRTLRIHQPGHMPASARNDSCSRCHQRVTPDAHPLSATPGPPLDDDGAALPPWLAAEEVGAPAPERFATAEVSRLHRDQVGDLSGSPHGAGWLGSCTDCHDPHGSANPAALRAPAGDDSLCRVCHLTAFPDDDAARAHARHPTMDAGTEPGCVDCHMARAGLVMARDPLSGVGETHDHGLLTLRPHDALAAFDAAGVDALPIDEVPVTACLDCHLATGQTSADPTARSTWEAEVQAWDSWEGSR